MDSQYKSTADTAMGEWAKRSSNINKGHNTVLGLEEIMSVTIAGRNIFGRRRMSSGIKQWMIHSPNQEEVMNTAAF